MPRPRRRATVKDGYCFLTMTAGPRSGTSFLLDPTENNRVGRGTDCDIILVDPLCSRVHAEIVREEDGWWLCDAASRNGTFLNGQKIDRARLNVGSTFRVGSTGFLFSWSDDPPTTNTDVAVAEKPTTEDEDEDQDADQVGSLDLTLEGSEDKPVIHLFH